MTKQYRQGDVLLHAVEAIPAQAVPVPGEGDRVIVAEGELTGHTHAFAAAEARLFQDEASGRLYLAIGQTGAKLRHEEHAPIALPIGHYEVKRQRQYAPGRLPFFAGD